MGDGLIACIGDGSVDIADSGSDKILGGAHFEIGELEAGGVGRRSGSGLGLAAKKKCEEDGDRNNDRNSDGDGALARIALFYSWRWLDQATHASIVLWKLIAGFEERGNEQRAE